MENNVYDITELIKCRLDEVDFILPNNHYVNGKLIREYTTDLTEKIDNDELKTKKYNKLASIFLKIIHFILYIDMFIA